MYQFPLPQAQVFMFRGDITSHSGLRALPTAGLQSPCVIAISIGDNNEEWKLRPRNAGENDNNTSFLVPNDYDPVANPVIFVRVG